MSRISISFPIIAVLLGVLSCEKSEVVSPTTSVPASEVSGNIVGWQFGDSMAISANAYIAGPGTPYVLASGSVRSNGTFYLSLPEPPPTTLLAVVGQHDTLSDTTARVLILNGLILTNPDQSIQYWIMNQYKASPQTPSTNDFYTFYFYADRPVQWRRSEIISGLGVILDLQLELRIFAYGVRLF